MTVPVRTAWVLAAMLLMTVGFAYAAGSGDPKPVTSQDGEYFDKNGTPTFHIENGTVDWYTYSGYLRYGANCLQCHGPDGMGSSYAPSLVDSLKTLNYGQFLATVAGGKKAVSSSQNLVMPAFGVNKNVMCYINPIFVYLRARADGALGRQRPDKHEPKPDAFSKAEDECMG